MKILANVNVSADAIKAENVLTHMAAENQDLVPAAAERKQARQAAAERFGRAVAPPPILNTL